MYIKTEQEFIFGGETQKGQWVLVEPKSYKKLFVLPPKDGDYSFLVEDRKYKFDLTVIVDVVSERAEVRGKTAYLNNVKFYINGAVNPDEEVSEDAKS